MKKKQRFISILLTLCLVAGLVPMTAFAAGSDLALDQGGYTSSYAAVFDGFEQRPALSELLTSIEGLTAENIEITGYGNNINATAEGDFAYAEIQGINESSGTSRIYFSIAPFNLSNARLLRSNASYDKGNALDNLLAIESEDGIYVIPGDSIALRQVSAWSEMVSQGGSWAERCYYMNSTVMNLETDGSYANTVPNYRSDQNRYFIVSNSTNFVVDDSSVEQGYWDYGLSRENRNNKLNEIFSSLSKTYFSFPDSMTITIGTFTPVSRIMFSVDSTSVYPDYDDGEIELNVSSNTEGVSVQKAVCNLIVNKDMSACNVTHQIDIYFTPAQGYVVAENAVCNLLSQSVTAQVDADTQWYKTSVIISQTNENHTWTDWQTDKEPTCTETGESVRWCTACGLEETDDISATGHSWSSWQSNGDGTHTRTCQNCSTTDTENCTGGTATCVEKAVCVICGEKYGEVAASNHTNLVKTEAKPSTHMTEGNIEYWHCDDCNKYFSDETGTEEITLEDTVIPKSTEHTADGTGWHSDETSHWNTCECGTTLNETAHTFEWVIDKEATATESGLKHEKCTVCGYEKAAVEVPATGTTEDPSGLPTDADTSTGDKDKLDTVTTKSPQTGYDSNIAILFTVILATGTAITSTILYKRKRKYSR